MLPPLPKWPLKPNGFREGGKLNQISDRIQRQSLISSKTILVSDTDRGQTLDNVAAAGAAGMLNLGFAVTKGAAVQVAAGKVVCSSWSGIDGNDPEPADWAVESNFTGAILASTVSAVWLQIQFTDADEESEGALGTESVDVSGSAGGRGGGGGGGGASNGDTSSYTVEAGENGADGVDGGAGGDGGRVLTFPSGTPVGGLGESEGGDGGTGGAGGDGGDGTSTTFTRATKSLAEIRRWSISSISAHSSKGTASDNATWVKLATITSGDITQHHIGVLHVAPPLVTYIAD